MVMYNMTLLPTIGFRKKGRYNCLVWCMSLCDGVCRGCFDSGIDYDVGNDGAAWVTDARFSYGLWYCWRFRTDVCYTVVVTR